MTLLISPLFFLLNGTHHQDISESSPAKAQRLSGSFTVKRLPSHFISFFVFSHLSLTLPSVHPRGKK
ncbi:hypothetical protein [Ktedonobacter sp. SOSP1-52]|uniref:hypothetical protein n=1 Tax=Ktedonobacter sp. SOSP1-52 TaxID=2778366 RepID=UPI00191673D1|nr:hypothetical protein [Ktedonobacter sp. SOSP1-52]